MGGPDNLRPTGWRARPAPQIRVDLVIPVLNEAHVIERSVRTVHAFLTARIPYGWRIVVAENGSTDGTADVVRRLIRQVDGVDLLVVGRRGRGGALRAAWSRSDADIMCYTDVDLSTSLDALPRLFTAIIDEGYDLAVGSRLARGSRTNRSLKREIVSRGYNAILKLALGVRFSDAQTGFKAVTRPVVERVLPLVKDDGWFLDTELLVLSERLGYRIADLPVVWVEDDDSRVKILKTAWDDLCGVARLRRLLGSSLGVEELSRLARAHCDTQTPTGGVEGGLRQPHLAVARMHSVRSREEVL
jgi:glycosyltransferase involved in cell wall biosynthesis